MDNASLIRSFVESVIAGKSAFLANAELRVEPVGHSLQLWAKQEGMISSAPLNALQPWITVKDITHYWSTVHDTLLSYSFLPTRTGKMKGFYQYEFASVPVGYQVNYTDGLLFLQGWWTHQQQCPEGSPLGMLLWHNQAWHPIRDVKCDLGTLNVIGWGSQITLQPADRTVWLQRIEPGVVPANESLDPDSITDLSDGLIASPTENPTKAKPSSAKHIGNYLVEAGLLSIAQVDVILCDQASTGMRFGEIAASRGWLKEQTIEYLMEHLILPKQANSISVTPVAVQRPSQSRPVHQNAHLTVDAPQHSIHDRETFVISLGFEDDTLN